MRFGNLFLVALLLFLLTNLVVPSDAYIPYDSDTGNGISYPKLRIWSSSGSWGPEIELPDSSSTITHAMLKQSSVNGKLVLITLGEDNRLDSYICQTNCNSSGSWILTSDIATTTDVRNTRRFDMAFEQSTGNLVLVYAAPSKLTYKILPSTAINFENITEQYIDETANYSWIKIDSKNNSNEIVLGGFSPDNKVNAWIWNGSIWSQQTLLATDLPSQPVSNPGNAIAVRYTSNGNAIILASNDSEVNYRYWNGSVWSPLSKFTTDSTIYWFSLKADPTSDNLQAVLLDESNVLYTSYWNGSSWATSQIATHVGSNGGMPADFEWYQQNSSGLLVFEDNKDTQYLVCSPKCTAAPTTISGFSNNARWITLARNPDVNASIKILGSRLNNQKDLGSFGWNDTLFNYGNIVITSDSDNVDSEITFAISLLVVDSTVPQINLSGPSNNSLTKSTSSLFTFVATSNATMNCSIYLDNILNQTNTIQNDTPSIFIVSGLTEGIHPWNIQCINTLGKTGSSETRNLIVDLSGPTIALLSPPDATLSNNSLIMLNFSAEDDYSSSLKCNLFLDSSLNQTTVINQSTGYYTTTLSDGIHTWEVQCADGAGNTAAVPERTITIDTTVPNITLLSPGGFSNLSEVSFEFDATDNGELACSLYIDGSFNQTVVSQTTVNISTGNHEWYMECVDEAANTATTPVQDLLVGIAAITVSKTGSVSALVGQEVEFIINVTNTGSLNLTLMVNDSLPAGLVFVNSSTEPLANTSLVWNATVAASDSFIVSYIVRADATGEYLNTVNVIGTPVLGDTAEANSNASLVVNLPVAQSSSHNSHHNTPKKPIVESEQPAPVVEVVTEETFPETTTTRPDPVVIVDPPPVEITPTPRTKLPPKPQPIPTSNSPVVDSPKPQATTLLAVTPLIAAPFLLVVLVSDFIRKRKLHGK